MINEGYSLSKIAETLEVNYVVAQGILDALGLQTQRAAIKSAMHRVMKEWGK